MSCGNRVCTSYVFLHQKSGVFHYVGYGTFRPGASPEELAQAFSTLNLSQIYGAIAYYPENEKHINVRIGTPDKPN